MSHIQTKNREKKRLEEVQRAISHSGKNRKLGGKREDQTGLRRGVINGVQKTLQEKSKIVAKLTKPGGGVSKGNKERG